MNEITCEFDSQLEITITYFPVGINPPTNQLYQGHDTCIQTYKHASELVNA